MEQHANGKVVELRIELPAWLSINALQEVLAMHEVTVRNWRNDRNLPWAAALGGVADARFSPDGETIGLALRGDRGKPGASRFELREVATGKVRRSFASSALVQAVAFFPSLVVIVVNLATDLVYGLVNPQVRLR